MSFKYERHWSYYLRTNNIYKKTLFYVLEVSYIQPFVDGNKLTSRLFGNAILLSENYTPLSYRSVIQRSLFGILSTEQY